MSSQRSNGCGMRGYLSQISVADYRFQSRLPITRSGATSAVMLAHRSHRGDPSDDIKRDSCVSFWRFQVEWVLPEEDLLRGSKTADTR